MKIAIGNDHVGTVLKNKVIEHIQANYDYEVVNYGTDSTERCDYPVYGEKVANAVASGECDKGILICGTGVGIGIAANKVNGIRCVTCSDTESAIMSREHNDANILSFGARILSVEKALEIVDAWFNAEFTGEERHAKRIAQIAEIEKRN